MAAKSRKKVQKQVDPKSVIEVKGWKALGNRLSPHKVLSAKFLTDSQELVEQTGTDKTGEEKPDKGKPSSSEKSSKQPKSGNGSTQSKTDDSRSDEEGAGFGVGSTVEFDVPSPKQQKDQLGLFEQQNES